VTRRHAAPIAIWAVTVAVGLVGGIAAVRQLLPDDHSEQALSVVPVPGADTTNGRVETAEVLMPAGTPAATTQPGIPDEITDWEDVRLVMPTLGEDVRVVEGVDLGALSRGVGHWPGTAEPGQTGNMVIAGHRTTHGAPFRRLDELRVGDDVGIGASGQVVTYRVTGTEIVDPGQVEVARPTTTATATLFACHPPGSAAKRIVVRLARSA
jgi:sortase A